MEVQYQIIGTTADNNSKMSTILNLDSPYRQELIYAVAMNQFSDTSSNSPQSTNSQESAEYNTNKYYMNNSPGSSNVNDNMSPSSNISEYSSYIQNLNLETNYEIASYNEHQPSTSTNFQQPQYTGHYAKPHLVITEQPVDKFRFRYQSEMHGTHGSLMGRRTEKSKKVYPTAELRGYNGTAIIRCTLYQVDGAKRSAHSHRLVIKHGDNDMNDPHDIIVSPEKGYSAVFQGMGIIHTAKKFIAQELYKKRRSEKIIEYNRELTEREELKEKAASDQESKTMNLNQVCLCFQAFHVDDNNFFTQISEAVYSESINNVKSAITGALKICRISSGFSLATGGDELFLFVEKVCKNNIKVRFYEVDEYDQEIWEDWGVFSEIDVHHQYAIALKTPPYKNPDIDQSVDVFIQLYRPRDQNRSEPIAFKYKPKLPSTSTGKRRRVTTSTYNSSEIPSVVNNTPTSVDHYDVTVSKEYNTPAMLQDIIDNQQTHTDISMASAEFRNFVLNSEELKNIILDISDNREEYCKLETDSVSKAKEWKGIEDFNKIYFCDKTMEHTKAKMAIAELFAASCSRRENCLHAAIDNNALSIVRQIIGIFKRHRLTHFLNTLNDQRETAVHKACLKKHIEILNHLIEADANFDVRDINGNTPLHLCSENNLTDCAIAILKLDEIKIDSVNNQGLTPLQLAVMQGHTGMVKLLIQNGASTDKIDLKNGDNILHLAVKQLSEKLVEIILKKTSDELVNEPNNSGFTPLHLACVDNKYDIVKLLLKNNANPLLTNGFFQRHRNKRNDTVGSGGSTDDSDNEIDGDDGGDESKNCFHLALNKPEILELLNNREHYANKKEIKDDEAKTSAQQLFDDICMDNLCRIFNKANLWRDLATLYDYTPYVDIWESNRNPSKLLFDYLEIQGDDLNNVIHMFEALNQQEAIKTIDEMVVRKINGA